MSRPPWLGWDVASLGALGLAVALWPLAGAIGAAPTAHALQSVSPIAEILFVSTALLIGALLWGPALWTTRGPLIAAAAALVAMVVFFVVHAEITYPNEQGLGVAGGICSTCTCLLPDIDCARVSLFPRDELLQRTGTPAETWRQWALWVATAADTLSYLAALVAWPLGVGAFAGMAAGRPARQWGTVRAASPDRPPGGTVFLSYAHDDVEFVDGLRDALEAAGYRVWRDAEDLRHGDSIPAGVFAAIAACAWFVPVVTPHYRASKWCADELGNAVVRANDRDGAGPAIVVVAVHDTPSPDMVLQRKRVVFRPRSYQAAFDDLVAAM